ncbi:cdc42 effector protein 4 [Perognathus longimembris pacificus]|uniref:cdc42 effector protein 4 n=1 Tax=Perognathus longimembris pacificus TaxID=214514 RepID=UPI002018C8C6|nr:cdc42 effector protein 4 [Perognathus longimembris pacificus]XP_048221226.1 cdc42 effector protein 4 [Perognathus longimembris pacificus]XP_048221227.1 cdc42 effector protein 4 [Perognathus longimembris pacificus]
MPILKQLVSSSVHSKRRSRVDLTAEMISAPLGDFRHTMHVGRAGDAFGDTSFLHSKAGEPDGGGGGGEAPDEPATAASKRGLLSRKFRGSKRSQSVTRGDREPPRDVLGSLRDSALFVKNAMSLPQLNEKEAAAERGSGKPLPKSLSSSPVKKADAPGPGGEAAAAAAAGARRNGAAAAGAPSDPALDEQAFGDLTDLPVVPKASHGLKHAESILSFHIDLGPSMLGDILSVMDKEDGWDPDGEGEGPGGGGGGGYRDPGEEEEEEEEPEGWAAAAPSPSSARSLGSSHAMPDSSSLSSGASGLPEERSPAFRGPEPRERARAAPPRQPDREFCFMDEEEEDEIRV